MPVSSSSADSRIASTPPWAPSSRSSDSFGPFFTERSLTSGRGQASFGVGYRTATFDNIDGRDLRGGTLVSTASILRGDAARSTSRRWR